MAERDKSQGFGFVYATPKQAYEAMIKNSQTIPGKTYNFNKDPKPKKKLDGKNV